MQKSKSISDNIYELARLIILITLCIQARNILKQNLNKYIQPDGYFIIVLALILGISVYNLINSGFNFILCSIYDLEVMEAFDTVFLIEN